MSSSVLFITESGESSSSWVRAHIPGMGLAKRGWNVCLAGVQFSHDDGSIAGAAPAKDGKGLGPLPITKYVVLRRMVDPTGKHASMRATILAARKTGQKVYIDLDDDPWNVPEWNPAHGTMSKKELSLWEKDMEVANGILVTTPSLAFSVADHVPGVPVHICPNGVDTSLYSPNMEWPHRPYRLAWSGTLEYRGADLDMMVDTLRESLEGKWGQVEFWHLGATTIEPSIHDYLGEMFPVQVRTVPWISLKKVPELFGKMDAAIIPQVAHPFSEARSAVTGLQFMAAGVPFVASPTAPYNQLWKQGGGYVVENSHDGWLHGLSVLLEPEYEQARRDIRTGGLALVRRYTPESVSERWEEAFSA